jgi:hypothetical protein
MPAVEVLIPAIVFGTIFGVIYLFFSTRHKERLALIEKGTDASVFYAKDKGKVSIWKLFLLNISLLFIAIGIGVFIASILVMNGVDAGVAYPGTIFLLGGIGLLTGFYLSNKMNEKKDSE